jgi:AraC family transcriptional regulator, ethanolamine operon transcriptional activator
MPAPAQKDPPPTLRTFQTRDIDEQAALLDGWNQTYNQLSGGAFSGELCEAALGHVYVFREKTNQSLHQVGALPDGLVAIGIPLSIPGSAKFCGQSCDGRQAHIFSGSNGFEYQTPTGLDMAGLVIPVAILHTVMLSDEFETLALHAQRARLKPIQPAVQQKLRLLLTGAVETLQSNQINAAEPALSGAFAADAARAVIACLSPDDSEQPLSLTETRCHAVVRDAQNLVLEQANTNLTIEDICRSLDISRRTLQTCFQRTLGIRPAQYLRAVRLNAARRTLKQCGSVTEAATAWGFWHFGRFAQDYRAMFAEAPSQTARTYAARRTMDTR